MRTLILDGIEYNLIPTLPNPKFKPFDTIKSNSYQSSYNITSISDDRYYVNCSNDYILFTNQDDYTKIGEFNFNTPKDSIYIVYTTYFNTVERLFSFTSEESAKRKCLELMWEFTNEDQFTDYLKHYNIPKTSVTVNTFWDYFIEVEDDSFTTYELVNLQS